MGSSGRRASERIDPGQSASIGAGLRFALPARIVQSHRLAAGIERMAAVELERLPAVVVVVTLLACEHLDRRGGKLAQQLGQVRAAAHIAKALVQRLAESA